MILLHSLVTHFLVPRVLKQTADHLYKRGEIWWVYYRTTNGKTIRESLKTKNKDVAEASLKQYRLKGVSSGSLGAYPIQRAIDAYIEEKVSNYDFTPSSARSSGKACEKNAQRLGVKFVQDVKQESSQTLYSHPDFYNTSEATARTYAMRWRGFLVWLYQMELLSKYPLPVKFSKRRNINKRKDVVRLAVAEKIISFTYDYVEEGDKPFDRDDLRYVLWCLFFCGMRRNEIIMSTPKWFDLSQREIKIPAFEETTDLNGRKWVWKTKNKTARTIPINGDFWAFLTEWMPEFFNQSPEKSISPPPFMLHSEAKGLGGKTDSYRWDPRKPFTTLIDAFRKAFPHDLPETVTMHTARHSFISALADKGIEVTKIALWSGDKIRTIEENYLHPLVKGHELDCLTE